MSKITTQIRSLNQLRFQTSYMKSLIFQTLQEIPELKASKALRCITALDEFNHAMRDASRTLFTQFKEERRKVL